MTTTAISTIEAMLHASPQIPTTSSPQLPLDLFILQYNIHSFIHPNVYQLGLNQAALACPQFPYSPGDADPDDPTI